MRSAIAGLVVLTAVSAAAATNQVTGLVLAENGGASTLRIVGSAPAQFTVFKLSEPARVVVDLAASDVSALKSPSEGKGLIAGVTTAQFKSGQGEVGRVVIAIADNARYEVKALGNEVVLTVSGEGAKVAPVVEPARAAQAPEAAPAVDTSLVTRRMDEKEVKKAATRLLAAEAAKGGLLLRTDGEVAKFELIELQEPARLALDLYGVQAPRTLASPEGTKLRLGKYDDRVRIVIDGAGARMKKYEVARAAKGVLVRLDVPDEPPQTALAPPQEVKIVEAPPKPEPPAAPAPPPAARKVTVRSVDYHAGASDATVDVAVSGKPQYEIQRDEQFSTLLIKDATIPEKLERTLDVSAFTGPVQTVSAYADAENPGVVKVVAQMRSAAADRIEWKDGRLRWRFAGSQVVSHLGGPRVAVVTPPPAVSPQAAGFATDAPAYALSSAPQQRKRYKGKPVDINLKDIELHNLFNYIAEVSKRNLVVADDVKGRITIRLRNVPWEEALDLILKARALGKEEIGNVIRIAPLDRLRAEQKEALAAKQNDEELAPLKVRLIPVNYAGAGDIAAKVKDILTKRGSITTDSRTNVLIVKDIGDSISKVESMVRQLDTQTPQVLIESRIVEASTSFVREVGIQWGGAISMAPVTGNPTGLVFPNAVQIAGATPSGGITQGVSGEPNFVVNMPAPIGLNTGAGLGFIFGSAGGAATLNLRLTAFENTGTIRTISAPRVTTLDNKEANISQGIKIPFSQTSAAGANTTFIEANLELTVTPHVTNEGAILLKIAASNNQPNPQLTGSNGQPSISKREAKTEVLLKDGDTTVIGGIYTRVNSSAMNEVPVLSKIPILGWLFKKKNERDDRTELLIFITPRIVNRSQSVVPTAGG